jgi:GTP cyclohydrolase I
MITTQSNDYELGKRIHNLLLAQKLENPIVEELITKWQDESYLEALQEQLAKFLTTLGLDLTDSSIAKTPNRVIKFFIDELFSGLDYRNFPQISASDNDFAYHSPLVSQGISVNSTCEHHLVSIKGQAIVAYIPEQKIVGLSKLNRVVDFFARRPQVQERLTRQILVTLQEVLATENVAVVINASHNCIVTRGVEDANTETLTMELGGKFLTDSGLNNNFYQLALRMAQVK